VLPNSQEGILKDRQTAKIVYSLAVLKSAKAALQADTAIDRKSMGER
jgi:hypothetical protein